MIDIKLVRENPEKYRAGVIAKGGKSQWIDDLLASDEKRRQLLQKIESLRSQQNKLSADLKDKPDKELITQATKFKKEIKALEPEWLKEKKRYQTLLRVIPNPPADDVKSTKGEKGNEVIRSWGEKPQFDFKIKDHLELGESLDLIDVKRAAKVSGSRFGYLKNEAALLEFALIQYALKLLIKEGFIPIVPPAMTRVSIFHELGYSQHGENEDYYLVYDPNKEGDPEPNYYLVGTAEHSLVPMHADEIFALKELPKRYVGFSTAFRREAGSWGKDTRGIFRVHQFDKLEMISFIEPQPESDKKEHEYLLSLEEKLVQGLNLSYQVVKMGSSDLGHPAARKYDIECWFPSQKRYRETHSVSTCTDYQSRALNIKYRTKDNQSDFVHILNGTAFSISRPLLAILENNQQKDGSVSIPKVLQEYVGKKVITPRS